MGPNRSLLAAAGLTALVVVAVIAVGGRQGAFGFGNSSTAAAQSADPAVPTPDTTGTGSGATAQPAYTDDDRSTGSGDRSSVTDDRRGDRSEHDND